MARFCEEHAATTLARSRSCRPLIRSDTNSAKTAVEILKTLVLQGKKVEGDAGFCQRDICDTLLSEHGDYLILVKDNQPTLRKEDIQAFVIPEGISPSAKHNACEVRHTTITTRKSRGCIERRTCDWPGTHQFLKLKRETTIQGDTNSTVASAMISRSVKSSTVEQRLALWRDCRAIKNRLFWTKYVTLREDKGRTRTDKAASAMSIIRNASTNDIRSSGHSSVAAVFRSNALQIRSLLTRLGLIT